MEFADVDADVDAAVADAEADEAGFLTNTGKRDILSGDFDKYGKDKAFCQGIPNCFLILMFVF